MNVWEIVVWWFTRGLIAWGAMVVMCVVATVEWCAKNDADGRAADILDMVVEETPYWTKGKGILYKIVDMMIDFIIWPIRVIKFAVDFVKMLNRADEMRNELYQE